MTRSIWKFPAAITDEFETAMPKGADILCVQQQDGVPRMWAIVEPAAELEQRRFRWFGTGHPFDLGNGPLGPEYDYIGTVQHDSGLVFHLFEVLS